MHLIIDIAIRLNLLGLAAIWKVAVISMSMRPISAQMSHVNLILTASLEFAKRTNVLTVKKLQFWILLKQQIDAMKFSAIIIPNVDQADAIKIYANNNAVQIWLYQLKIQTLKLLSRFLQLIVVNILSVIIMISVNSHWYVEL